MKAALNEAQKAFHENEVPVGCVIICQNQIIGKGFNLTEKLNDVTAHAEMQAITAASNYLGAKYLIDCTMYVTIEPCVMCAGAIFWSQIGKLVYAASDEKRGFSKVGNLLHPKTVLIKGVFEKEASELMTIFFKKIRET